MAPFSKLTPWVAAAPIPNLPNLIDSAKRLPPTGAAPPRMRAHLRPRDAAPTRLRLRWLSRGYPGLQRVAGAATLGEMLGLETLLSARSAQRLHGYGEHRAAHLLAMEQAAHRLDRVDLLRQDWFKVQIDRIAPCAALLDQATQPTLENKQINDLRNLGC